MEENEIIMLVLSIVVLVFIKIYKKNIRQVKGFRLLFSSFLFFLFACFCTNLEIFIWPSYLNLLEHLSYTTSVILMFLWSYKYLISEKKPVKHD